MKNNSIKALNSLQRLPLLWVFVAALSSLVSPQLVYSQAPTQASKVFENETFCAGARGEIVKEIQHALGIKEDGFFGATDTVPAVRKFQRSAHLPETGCMGPAEFKALHLEWPSVFKRALNLTSISEGTSYERAVGECNTRTLDGVTTGIIGFQMKSGSLQKVLRRMMEKDRASVESIASKTLGEALWKSLLAILGADTKGNPSPDRITWGMEQQHAKQPELFSPTGMCYTPTEKVKEFFAQLANVDAYRQAQLEVAKEIYWNLAMRDAKAVLGDAVPTSQAMAVLFDIAVFSYGLGTPVLNELKKKTWITQQQRMEQAVAEKIEHPTTSKHSKGTKRRYENRATGAGELPIRVYGFSYEVGTVPK